MDCSYRFPDARIIVFAKEPKLGFVKTRLRGHFGARGALCIYKHLLRMQLENVTQHAICPVEVWSAPTRKHPFLHACRRHYGVVLRRQCRGDLGKKMFHAFKTAKQANHCALIVGADAPALSPAIIEQALRSLQSGVDAVIVPAIDGGYVAIALNQLSARLFHNMTWSTAKVFQQTLARIKKLGWSCLTLPVQADVDEVEDIKRLRRAKCWRGYP